MPLTPPPRHRARTVVRLRGELTPRTAPRPGRKLASALARAPDIIEVDLTEATCLTPDASGLQLACAATARRLGTSSVITHASPRHLQMLRELGMQHLMDEPLLPDP
ncbi:STAS domain-containing protein [Streptomyces sp. Qhu-G9]|uniref:STAS domain-containing protein n=1 Tax=Streptomyces sp. Qhu-G9 TaxID=3452799 RepID=UPI0022ABFB29|nr:STAS domain-containing protein [Streptomyces aurantiacus]WAU81452.1 STAS domain-containing protein [Streptomyces aurantiacus]